MGILAVAMIVNRRSKKRPHKFLGLWFLLAYMSMVVPIILYLIGWIDIDNISDSYFLTTPIMILIGALCLPLLGVYSRRDFVKTTLYLLASLSSIIMVIFSLLEWDLIMPIRILFGLTIAWMILGLYLRKVGRDDGAVLYFPFLVACMGLWWSITFN